MIYIAQPKLDGVFVQIHKKENNIWIYTRQGKDIGDNIPEIQKQILDLKIPVDFIVEGELVPTISGMTFQSVMQRVTRKHDRKEAMNNTPLKVLLFNIIYWNNEHLFDMDYKDRFEILKNFGENVITSIEEYNSNLDDFFNKCIKDGHEGLMLKQLDGKYYPGRRTNDVLKWKLDFNDIDCAITKIYLGTGKYKDTVGAIEIGLKDKNDKIIGFQRVGSGLSDFDREKLLQIRDKNNDPIKNIVCEIHFGDVTDDGNLRFPIFACIREDLSFKDVKSFKDIERIYK